MSMGIPMGCMYKCNAVGPAQDGADSIGLPMTQFYHPDHGWNFTNVFANVLKDKRTVLYVTWIPTNYFEGHPNEARKSRTDRPNSTGDQGTQTAGEAHRT